MKRIAFDHDSGETPFISAAKVAGFQFIPRDPETGDVHAAEAMAGEAVQAGPRLFLVHIDEDGWARLAASMSESDIAVRATSVRGGYSLSPRSRADGALLLMLRKSTDEVDGHLLRKLADELEVHNSVEALREGRVPVALSALFRFSPQFLLRALFILTCLRLFSPEPLRAKTRSIQWWRTGLTSLVPDLPTELANSSDAKHLLSSLLAAELGIGETEVSQRIPHTDAVLKSLIEGRIPDSDAWRRMHEELASCVG